ncbi:MAG: hypothetical protein ACLPYB_05420 [Desulfobaccales bacterium]
MTFEEIKTAVMGLDDQGKKRVVMELLPEIWPKIVEDAACLEFIRELVDAEAVRIYKEEHMDTI